MKLAEVGGDQVIPGGILKEWGADSGPKSCGTVLGCNGRFGRVVVEGFIGKLSYCQFLKDDSAIF